MRPIPSQIFTNRREFPPNSGKENRFSPHPNLNREFCKWLQSHLIHDGERTCWWPLSRVCCGMRCAVCCAQRVARRTGTACPAGASGSTRRRWCAHCFTRCGRRDAPGRIMWKRIWRGVSSLWRVRRLIFRICSHIAQAPGRSWRSRPLSDMPGARSIRWSAALSRARRLRTTRRCFRSSHALDLEGQGRVSGGVGEGAGQHPGIWFHPAP